MEIMVEPVDEEIILRQVDDEASSEEIQEALIDKAQCCVDHLCGCSPSVPTTTRVGARIS